MVNRPAVITGSGFRVVLATALLAWSWAAGAACNYPTEVTVPDGKSATAEDMNAAAKSVKQYMADMDTYLSCLDAEEAALPPEQQTDETKALTVKRHNAAVDAMETMAARYNEQVRAFKAANQ